MAKLQPLQLVLHQQNVRAVHLREFFDRLELLLHIIEGLAKFAGEVILEAIENVIHLEFLLGFRLPFHFFLGTIFPQFVFCLFHSSLEFPNLKLFQPVLEVVEVAEHFFAFLNAADKIVGENIVVGDCPFQLGEGLLSEEVLEVDGLMLVVVVVYVVLAALVADQLSVVAVAIDAEVFESVFLAMRAEVELGVEELVDELTVQPRNVSRHLVNNIIKIKRARLYTRNKLTFCHLKFIGRYSPVEIANRMLL